MMKKEIIATLCLSLVGLAASGQVNRTNYVKRITMLDSIGNDRNIAVQYYDGFCRPSLKAEEGEHGYLFTQTDYDIRGREYNHWLPFPHGSQPYISSYNDYEDDSRDYYEDADPNTTIWYDNLDRVTARFNPGEEWHMTDGVTTVYRVNTANSVKRYRASMSTASLIQEGYYPAGVLSSTLVADEDGKTLETFCDELGRTVLERRDGSNDTYYVYNDLGLLRYVLSPQYQQQNDVSLYAYEYRYDERRRVVKKILPGCAPIDYWYDSGDRLMFMRDARLSNAGRYRFYLYDHLGRLCVQGTCDDCNRGDYNAFVTYALSNGSFCDTGYQVDKTGSIINPELEICNYYDNYGFINTAILGGVVSGQLARNNAQVAQGLQTGSIAIASNGEKIYKAIYYDYEGRPEVVHMVGLDGLLSVFSTAYTFTGKPREENLRAVINGVHYTVTSANTYSNRTELLRSTSLTFAGGAPHRTSYFVYDDVNRLKSNQRSGSAGTVTYDYNVQSWMTAITSPQFTEQLYYIDGPGSGCYNGNISSMQWTTANEGIKRGYMFEYDGLNRLTDAVYGEGSDIGNNANRYTERISRYTANGSPVCIERYGRLDNGSYNRIDNLSLTYNGNQLKAVSDAAPAIHYNGAFDFRDGANLQTEYTYDGCGSLTSDANKGIAHIDYDLTGMPRRIQFTNGNVTEYVYTPTGEKLRTIHRTAVADLSVPIGSTMELTTATTLNTETTDYLGNLILKNGKPDRYLFNGGYCSYPANPVASSQPTFHYYTKDHLGNNRTVVNENGTLEQVTHYYPFGGIFGDATLNAGIQPYKYNGKEFDHVHGLNWYDYGARQYDPILARWDRMDPLCEKFYPFSPYNYCGNSPIKNIDPDGKDWYTDKDGTIQYNPNVHSQADLGEKQVYLWKERNNGKTGVYFRNDGSILYNNETTAYRRMWSQADKHYRTKDCKGGREITGFILSNGKVLVLPDYKNDATNSYISEYGYKVSKDGTLIHGNECYKVLANIHTHQDRSVSAAPSYYTYDGYGDMGISIQMGGKPVLSIGWDEEIHGIRSNSIKTLYIIPFSRNLRQRKNLLNGNTKMSRIIKCF